MQLKIDTKTKESTISAHFGMKGDRFNKLRDDMALFLCKELVHDLAPHEHDKNGKCLKDKPKKDGDGLKTNVIDTFQKYLKSKEFAKMKWKPESANDFFLLGFMYASARQKADRVMRDYVIDEMLPEALGDALGGLFGRMGKKIEVHIKK